MWTQNDFVALCPNKNHTRGHTLKMDQVSFSWENETKTADQSEKLCSSVSLIHAAAQTDGCSIRLFCCEACSESPAWFMKYSHVHRSCCSPADKSQVLLMLHFLCCHSGLFWWLLLWVGWVGEKATWEKDGERICSEREWRIWIWLSTHRACVTVTSSRSSLLSQNLLSNQPSCSNSVSRDRRCHVFRPLQILYIQCSFGILHIARAVLL